MKNGYTSDYTDYAHEDIFYHWTDGLEQICCPYGESALVSVFCQQCVDLEDKSRIFSFIFKSVFVSLANALDTIIYYEKRAGSDGIFDFISQFIDIEECIKDGPVFFFNDETLKK